MFLPRIQIPVDLLWYKIYRRASVVAGLTTQTGGSRGSLTKAMTPLFLTAAVKIEASATRICTAVERISP